MAVLLATMAMAVQAQTPLAPPAGLPSGESPLTMPLVTLPDTAAFASIQALLNALPKVKYDYTEPPACAYGIWLEPAQGYDERERRIAQDELVVLLEEALRRAKELAASEGDANLEPIKP